MLIKLKFVIFGIIIVGDGRYDSMGYSVKYGDYIIFCCIILMIIYYVLV